MSMSFPTAFEAWYIGVSRDSGEFVNDQGEKIVYGRRLQFQSENADGIMETLEIPETACMEAAAGLKFGELERFSPVVITGEVVLRPGKNSFFRPEKIEPAS